MNFCGILAGGTGIRMGGDIPKQFIDLCKKPIIIHTLQNILSMHCFDYVITAIHPDWGDYLTSLLGRFDIRDDIIMVSGGKERIDSIENIVGKAMEIDSAKDNIIVLHDAVRPFVTEKIIKDGISNAAKYNACVAGVKAIDTVYEIDDNSCISGFPQRKYIIYGQTPDSFNLNILNSALKSLSTEERKQITGTVQICAKQGIKIKVTEGSYNNIKITEKKDLYLAQSIIKEGEG